MTSFLFHELDKHAQTLATSRYYTDPDVVKIWVKNNNNAWYSFERCLALCNWRFSINGERVA